VNRKSLSPLQYRWVFDRNWRSQASIHSDRNWSIFPSRRLRTRIILLLILCRYGIRIHSHNQSCDWRDILGKRALLFRTVMGLRVCHRDANTGMWCERKDSRYHWYFLASPVGWLLVLFCARSYHNPGGPNTTLTSIGSCDTRRLLLLLHLHLHLHLHLKLYLFLLVLELVPLLLL